jgi:histidinol phosphatase-like enzyme
MLERAARRFRIDLSASYFIGDTTTDLKTAKNAGCAALLVRTGKGGKDKAYRVKADKTFKDLGAAAAWITRI